MNELELMWNYFLFLMATWNIIDLIFVRGDNVFNWGIPQCREVEGKTEKFYSLLPECNVGCGYLGTTQNIMPPGGCSVIKK